MSMLFWAACVLIVMSFVLCFIRLILGPHLADRVVTIDLLTNVVMGSIALFSVYSHQAVYMDIIVAFALVMFLSTTMYSYYLEQKNKRESSE